ncbi:MAG: hypothetical protein IJJ48_05955, partial [Firmicutes bacterium]|nr:hypothetical protein [Bacillota bacterium]
QPFYCVVTDINGNKTISEKATLTVANGDERKSVLYIIDYALEPGESVDLAEAGIGSGTVSYHDDGLTATFNEVTINTGTATKDQLLCAGAGVMLRGLSGSELDYRMIFKGSCTINNDLYDPEFDGGGVCLNSHFLKDSGDLCPTLTIEADDLVLNGGLNSIYSDGFVELYGKITANPYEDHRLNSISAKAVHIGKNAVIDINGRGTGILASGTLFIEDGAKVDLKLEAPRLGNNGTETQGIYCSRLYCTKADLNIDMKAHAKDFEPYGKTVQLMCGIRCVGQVEFHGTDVDIKLDADTGETYFANNFYGITGDPLASVELYDGAKVKINMDSKSAYTSVGLGTGGPADTFIIVEDGSELDIDVKTSGHVLGIDVRQRVSVTDSSLKVSAASYDTAIIFGVYCPSMEVDLKDSKYEVAISAENGIALFATDTDVVDTADYEEGYEPKLIKIYGDAKILAPEEGEINRYGFDPYRSVTPGESVYSKDDKEEAASAVRIAVPKGPSPETGELESILWLGIMALCLAGAAVMYMRRASLDGKHYRQ